VTSHTNAYKKCLDIVNGFVLLAALSAVQQPKNPPDPTGVAVEITGHIVGEKGTPLPDASVETIFMVRPEPGRGHGVGLDEQRSTIKVDSTGRFRIDFDYSKTEFLTLRFASPDRGAKTWGWEKPGSKTFTPRIELGEIGLLPGGFVRGTVVDKVGKPIPGKWRIKIEPQGWQWGPRVVPAPVSAVVDEATGTFQSSVAVAAGPVVAVVESDLVRSFRSPGVEVLAGKESNIEVTYDGPDLSKNIVVFIDTGRMPRFFWDEAPGILTNQRGETRKPSINTGSSLTFDDLPDDLYTATIEDDRFRPWRSAPMRPGQTIRAQLSGPSRLQLRVEDAETSEPIHEYSLTLHFPAAGGRSNESVVRSLGEPEHAGGIYEGLWADLLTILVDAPGHVARESIVGMLKPGETRAAVVSLERGGGLACRVVSQAGAALGAGIEVSVVPDPTEDDRRAFRGDLGAEIRRFQDKWGKSAITDSSGAISFVGLLPRTYTITATLNEFCSVERSGFRVESNQRGELTLVMPANRVLEGRLLGPEGATFAGIRVGVQRIRSKSARGSTSAKPRNDELFFTDVDTKGEFRAGPLLLGSYNVYLTVQDTSLKDWDGGGQGLTAERRRIAKVILGKESDEPLVVDIREMYPGSLRLEVTVGDSPLRDGSAYAAPWPPSPMLQKDAVAGTLQPGGVMQIGPLFPGKWIVRLLWFGKQWGFVAPEVYEVEAGVELRAKVKIPIVKRQIRLIDPATRKGHANLKVLLETPAFTGSMVGTTDSDGFITLELPTQDYEIRVGSKDVTDWMSGQHATLHWALDTPATLEVARIASGR
jgi:hypothetical protein